MSSGPDLDLESTSSTGADIVDASTGDDCEPCNCDEGVAVVGALDTLADAAAEPAAIAPAVAVVIWWILRRRKRAAKPAGG